MSDHRVKECSLLLIDDEEANLDLLLRCPGAKGILQTVPEKVRVLHIVGIPGCHVGQHPQCHLVR